jgi:hypothetical protein
MSEADARLAAVGACGARRTLEVVSTDHAEAPSVGVGDHRGGEVLAASRSASAGRSASRFDGSPRW